MFTLEAKADGILTATRSNLGAFGRRPASRSRCPAFVRSRPLSRRALSVRVCRLHTAFLLHAPDRGRAGCQRHGTLSLPVNPSVPLGTTKAARVPRSLRLLAVWRGLVPAGSLAPLSGHAGTLVSSSVRSSGRSGTALAPFGSLEVSCEC